MTVVLKPELDCIERFVPSRGFQRGKYRDRHGSAAVINHWTGLGLVKNWRRRGAPRGLTVFEYAIEVYSKKMDASGHVVIGPGGLPAGEVVQMVPLGVAAWGVGSTIVKHGRKRKAASVYSGDWAKPIHGWWLATQYPLTTPLDLAKGEIWRGGSVNDNCYHIEHVPDPANPTQMTQAQREASIIVNRGLIRWGSIPLHPSRVTTHAIVHPLARTARGMPSDPPISMWNWVDFRRDAGF